jgi:hypothetical protein
MEYILYIYKFTLYSYTIFYKGTVQKNERRGIYEDLDLPWSIDSKKYLF